MKNCTDKSCKEKDKICIPDVKLPRIVVVGGGFAGINLVKDLHGAPFQVVMLDENNFHQFSPLLYQVATSGIEPDSIVFPFRKLFRNSDKMVFRMTKAVNVDPENNVLHTTNGSVKYDYLVLATGSATNYFGNEGFQKYAQGLKSVPDALNIRHHILQNLEKATVSCDPDEKETLSSIAIVGGGPTGVELAGALAEFNKYILPHDYPELKEVEMKIMLLEGVDRLLPMFPEKLSGKTERYLKELGVYVKTNSMVKEYDGEKARLTNDELLKAGIFIWTAGVRCNAMEGIPEDKLNKQNRITVDEYGQVSPFNNIFAIGDTALYNSKEFPKGHPMVAQAAIQQGKVLAANFINMSKNKPLKPFKYNDKGSLTTIGKKKAVAKIRNKQFSGFFAWLIWSFVHLLGMFGARNKLLVAVNWMWSYFNYEKGDRVIIRKYQNQGDMKQTEEQKKGSS